jgi:hypothetical protein
LTRCERSSAIRVRRGSRVSIVDDAHICSAAATIVSARCDVGNAGIGRRIGTGRREMGEQKKQLATPNHATTRIDDDDDDGERSNRG